MPEVLRCAGVAKEGDFPRSLGLVIQLRWSGACADRHRGHQTGACAAGAQIHRKRRMGALRHFASERSGPKLPDFPESEELGYGLVRDRCATSGAFILLTRGDAAVLFAVPLPLPTGRECRITERATECHCGIRCSLCSFARTPPCGSWRKLMTGMWNELLIRRTTAVASWMARRYLAVNTKRRAIKFGKATRPRSSQVVTQ